MIGKRKNAVGDKVWFSKGLLYCRFRDTGLTQSITAINPDSRLSIDVYPNVVGSFAIYSGELPLPGEGAGRRVVVEAFRTHDDAVRALDLIEEAVIAGSRRWRVYARRTVMTVVALLAGLIGIGMIKQGITTQTQGEYHPTVQVDPFAVKPPQAADAAAASPLPVEPPKKIDIAALKGATTIRIGNGKPVAYVFADPKCSSCREAEPMFERTGKPFAIIPVAILGEQSALEAVRILCSKDPVSSWKASLEGTEAKLATTDKTKLSECAQKIVKNMEIFRSTGMVGTPTIVLPDGRVSMLNSETDVKRLFR